MFFKHNSLIYIIWVSLSVAYSSSIAAPAFYGYEATSSANVLKVEKQQRNPWAMRLPAERDATQYFQPSMPERGMGKFITDEELDALNNYSTSNKGARFSHGWMPLPSIQGSGQKPYNESPSHYSPADKRMKNDAESRGRTDKGQWRDPSLALPVDPMDPGRHGIPFSGPFRGIDSFVYE